MGEGTQTFRSLIKKKYRQALGLEKPDAVNFSPAGSTVTFHVRAETPEELTGYLDKSGNPLNTIKTGKIEIKPTERARELLAGDVATEHDLRDKITEMVERMGTQTAVATELGVSTSTLGDVLLGRRGVGGKVIRNLGYERIVVYRRR
jgi:hypothetical protein